MPTAPPVRYPARLLGVARGAERGVFLLGLALLAVWLGWTGAPRSAWGLAGLVAAPGLFCLGRAWRLGAEAWPGLELVWDGRVWSLVWDVPRAVPWRAEGGPQPLLDLQSVLLLRLRSETGAGRWLLLCRRGAPARWHLLRCAVYSRAVFEPPGPPDGGRSGVAPPS